MIEFTPTDRRARLGRRHHLATPALSPTEVAGDLAGLHSSDPASVYLALRARVRDFEISHLDDALYRERSLVRMLGMRRTMFVVPIDLAAVMDAACTQALVPAQEKRLAAMLEEEGLASDGVRWIARVEADTLAALARRGPATARELTEEVPELGLKIAYATDKSYGGTFGVSTRILFLLATRGAIVRARPLGTWVSSQYRWALTDEWLGSPLTFPDAASARADLASRWLFTFGPGSENDLKWWTGWNLRDTRAALGDVDAVEVDLGNGRLGYVLPDDVEPEDPPPPWAEFLPALDPTPMGWKDRQWYLGDHHAILYDRNGNIGPSIWVNGRVVGGWSQSTDGTLHYRLIEPVDGDERGLVETAAAATERWLDGVVVKPRFGTPLDKELRQL